MAITKRKITEALHGGACTASESYRRWSGGLTLAGAPEYLIVVEIARNVNQYLGERECLRLEMPYRDVLAGARLPKGPGAPLKSIRGGKKADLALLKNGASPTCIIEVKKDPDYKRIVGDLERLRDVVYACRHKPRVLKHGFLLIWRSSNDTDSEIDTIDGFFKDKRNRARAKRPSIKTWRCQASIVVEVTAAKSG